MYRVVCWAKGLFQNLTLKDNIINPSYAQISGIAYSETIQTPSGAILQLRGKPIYATQLFYLRKKSFPLSFLPVDLCHTLWRYKNKVTPSTGQPFPHLKQFFCPSGFSSLAEAEQSNFNPLP